MAVLEELEETAFLYKTTHPEALNRTRNPGTAGHVRSPLVERERHANPTVEVNAGARSSVAIDCVAEPPIGAIPVLG